MLLRQLKRILSELGRCTIIARHGAAREQHDFLNGVEDSLESVRLTLQDDDKNGLWPATRDSLDGQIHWHINEVVETIKAEGNFHGLQHGMIGEAQTFALFVERIVERWDSMDEELHDQEMGDAMDLD
jgi:hypothetical protein